MKILHNFDELLTNEKTAVTVGKFDGLHTGHELLIDHIVKKRSEGYLAAAVTFDRPVGNVIFGKKEKVLMTLYEKRALLEHQGVDILVELPFHEQIRKLSPEAFIHNLTQQLHMKYMIVGKDFTFGHKGRGDVCLLRTLAAQEGFALDVIDKIKSDDRDISSTFIREEIAAGHIEHANALLGYSYYIIGRISHGNQIGSRKIGRPTINIIPPEDKLMPPNGVYVTEAVLLGRTYHGVTNVGLRPTVEEAEKRLGVETHILDFDRDVYDKEAKIVFKSFIRPERKFEDFATLKAQIEQDVRTTYQYFNGKQT